MHAESTGYNMFKIFWRRLFLGCDSGRLLYIYGGVTGSSRFHCQGRWIYVPWSWWHNDTPKRQYLSQITWHNMSSLHSHDHGNLVWKIFSVFGMKWKEVTKTGTRRTETHYVCSAMNKISTQLPVSNHTYSYTGDGWSE